MNDSIVNGVLIFLIVGGTAVLTAMTGFAVYSLLKSRPKPTQTEEPGESYRTPGRREEVLAAFLETPADAALRAAEASHKAAQASQKAAYWALALSLTNVGLWIVRTILER